jgi:hypothetical protein
LTRCATAQATCVERCPAALRSPLRRKCRAGGD